MSEFPIPAEIVRLIAERGRDGRAVLFQNESPGRIAALCDALKIAGDAHVRKVLCNLLASLADPEALPCLLERLDDPEPSVVAATADAVGNCAYDQTISADLRESLGTKLIALAGNGANPLAVRTGSIYGLGLLRYAPAVSHLTVAIESEAPLERSASAEALAHIGDREAIPALQSRLSREGDARVKRFLNLALEEIAEK